MRMRELEAAFHRPYLGEALNNFIRAVDWCEANYDASQYCGRMIAILQSSGTGKSRMVEELATQVRNPVGSEP